MDDGSVGSIFLDLIVRDTVQKQTEKIAAKAQVSAKQSFGAVERSAEAMTNQIAAKSQEMGQRIQNSINDAFNKSVALAQAKVTQLETALASVTAKLNDAKASDNDTAAQILAAQQEAMYDRLEAARNKLAIEIKAAAQKEAQAEAATKAKQEAAAQKTADAAEKAAQAAAKAHERSASRIKSAFSKAFSGAKKVTNGFGKAISGIKERLSSAGKSAGRFGTRLKSIVSGALVFNLLSSALRKMTDYLGTAIGSSTEMQDALANLKGAAMTAVAPIVEMLTPALTALANGAATALSYLTRLISFFTGKSVSAMSSAAKKIQSTANTAKKAMASVAGFDEIQKLDGKDGSGEDDVKVEPNYDFQGKSSFLDSVVESVKEGNWKEVGTIVAQKLSSALAAIKWPDIQAKAKEWMSGAAQSINGFIGSLDFAAIAKGLSKAAIGLLDMLTAWITDMDWQQIGNAIAKAVAAVDWDGLVSSLWGGIGAALAGLTELIWGLIEDAWAGVVAWWYEVAFEDGQFTMKGLLKGIGDIFVNIGSWIKTNIFDPFINGFKNAFDIHSPSGEMENMGDFLIQGLLQGITNTWKKITDFFNKAFASLKNLFKGSVNGILGFINGLISGVINGVNLIVRAMNKLKFDVPDWVPGLGGKSFGFNLAEVTAPKIPLLAGGGVIRQPTLAMMGEYSGASSNPEIVAPQSMIAEIVARAMSGLNETNHEIVELLRDILQAVLGIERGDEVYATAVRRHNEKMSVIRGVSY